MQIRQFFRMALLLVFLVGGNSLTAQHTSAEQIVNARTSDLCNKQAAFELWKLYKDSVSYMNKQMRLNAKMLIYKDFNRPEKVIESIDSLFTYYPSESNQPGYYFLKAHCLLEMGRYREFATYCDSLGEDPILSKHPNYVGVESRARQLEAIPDYTIELPGGECTVPMYTSFNPYLLQLSVQINDGEPQEIFLDTGAPYTFLSYKTAKKYNIPLIGDTVIAASVFGEFKSRMGIMKELRIGELIFRNLIVGVALEDVPDFFKNNDLLGLQELQKLSAVEFSQNKITFKKNRQKGELCPNMYVQDGGLLLRTWTDNNQIENYQFDTGSGENFFFIHDSVPSNSIERRSILGNQVVLTNNQAKKHILSGRKNEGLLGLPFFQSFESAILDFDRMAFIGKDYKVRPGNYSFYINSGDYANLEANFQWCENRTDEMGRWIMRAFLGFMKNQPEKSIQYTDSLLAKYQEQLADGIMSVLSLRAVAFAYTGDYTSAHQLMGSILPSAPYFKGSMNKCLALETIGAPKIDWHAPETVLPATLQDNGLYIEAGINNKKSGLYFAPNKIDSRISPEDAAKYEMKIIEFEEETGSKTKMAIAQEFALGDVTVRNAQFNIDEKADTICIGNSLLRLIPQYTLEKNQLVLSCQSASPKQNIAWHPLLMINYVLCYYHANGDKVETFAIGNPYPNAQMITLKELLKQNKKVTFNTRNMYMQFVRE